MRTHYGLDFRRRATDDRTEWWAFCLCGQYIRLDRRASGEAEAVTEQPTQADCPRCRRAIQAA